MILVNQFEQKMKEEKFKVSDLEQKLGMLLEENERVNEILDENMKEKNYENNYKISLEYQEKIDYLEKKLEESKSVNFETQNCKKQIENLQNKIYMLIDENNKINKILEEKNKDFIATK